MRAVREVRVPSEKARADAGARDGDDGGPAGGFDELVAPGTRGVAHKREIHGHASWRAHDALPA